MIISIASQKGGVGKTTTSISIAAGLAHEGNRILLIDMDSQANSTKVLSADFSKLRKEESIYTTIIDKNPLPVVKSNIENLFIVPSHILLSETDITLTTAMDHREARLKDKLDLIKNEYDHIIIDCPPALSWLTLNAFTASDELLVVVAPGPFEIDAINQLSQVYEQVKREFNKNLKMRGFAFVMTDPTNASKISLQILRQAYSSLVLDTTIPRNTDIRDAHLANQDIFTFNSKSAAANGYKKLITEIFNV